MKTNCTRRTFLKAAATAATVAGSASILCGSPAYQNTWDSLAKHAVPGWFADAKFGIIFHWGIYTVPAFDSEWYSRNMYLPDHKAAEYHKLVYGPPSKFGYKDFIPMFRGERFNAEEWALLFRKAGARFAGPVTEHADGFSLWDSKVNEWNAARMGPRRDVVGELSRAIRNEGMKFLATFHHQWLWGWYPTVDKSLDAGDPKYAGLYGPPAPGSPFNYHGYRTHPLIPPPQDFQDIWEAKVKEVIDKYHPDHIYFDSRMEIIDERRRIDLVAYHYNQAEKFQHEVGLSYKQDALPADVAILDLECGRVPGISPRPWLTDDVIDWTSWCYVQKPDYKSANRLIGQLIDITSRNGTLLLDINPASDGVMPEPTVDRLLAIGEWLRVNGEAIYGTRPWKVNGEGPTDVKSGEFSETKTPELTANDFRFTSRWKTLYAIACGWPQDGNEIVIKSLNTNDKLLARNEIANITLLGSDAKLTWQHDAQGLKITLPPQKPGDHAFVYKILLN
jgi:alpha-L-fucosidase